MKKKIILFLISAFFCALSFGCSGQDTVQEDKKTPVQDKLTMEQVKSNYEKNPAWKLVETTDYRANPANIHYVLVEYINDAGRDCFDWYNLHTGDKDEMPLIASLKAKLVTICSPDMLIFETDGRNVVNSHRSFPQIVECYRNQEVVGYEGDFYPITSPKYQNISEGAEFGNKSGENISDIKITLQGIQVLFEPIPGREAEFYTAYTTIPVTKISYSNEGNKLIVEFPDTGISAKLPPDSRNINIQNNYLSHLELIQDGTIARIVIGLKDTAKYYTAKDTHVEPAVDDFPCVNIEFASEYSKSW